MIVSFYQFNIDLSYNEFNYVVQNVGLFIFVDIPVMNHIVTQASFPRNHTV